MSKLRVALVFGGVSSEHSISCATAAGVLGAINREKYEVVPVGITKTGLWTLAADDIEKWKLRKGELAEVLDEGNRVDWAMDGSRELWLTDSSGTRSSLGKIDLIFPVLHGPKGEDGTVQGYFELLGIPYVGNGVLASAAGMDKEFTKALFEAAGVPCTPHVVVHERQMLDDPESVIEKIRGLGGLPIFVKPARAGSSVGVSKVSDWDAFGAAAELALEHDSKFVVERGVVGREVEVAVLSGRGGAAPRVSVAGEIIVKGREFYDFDAKYQDEDSVDLVVPADLSADELAEMQRIAAKAYRSLGCYGLARVDFFLTANGFLVNEINTLPGFTPLSMFPSLWATSGIAYAELIDELIQLALEAKR